ncbi:MAG: hypothetical protein ACOVNU_00890 [Candidatus Kapaibacteriota bacterium]
MPTNQIDRATRKALTSLIRQVLSATPSKPRDKPATSPRQAQRQVQRQARDKPHKMSISLMDIFNTESSLSEKILGDNNAPITVCINGTCSMFNKMTAEDITQHREEYYIQYLPVKIEKTIEKKMFAVLKNPRNVCVYKEPKEYDADLEKLASHINENNRDSILEKMINKYKDYVRDYYHTGGYEMFDILMKEFSVFVQKHMKYEITRRDFEEEEVEIYDAITDM